MRISRTWVSLALALALSAAVLAEEKMKQVETMEEDGTSAEEQETVAAAESRPLQPQQHQDQADDRIDDRDKRQLVGQHHLLQRLPNLGGVPPQGFRAAPVQESESDGLLSRNSLSSTASPVHLVRQGSPVQVTYRATPSPVGGPSLVQQPVYRTLPTPLPSSSPAPSSPQRRVVQQPSYTRVQPSRQQYADLQQVSEEQASEELEPEKEEPDRLTELLPHSKFSCQSRNTGYYADEGLSCEVFHYCQDGARHSWICPDGFTFHQVHLICMPPSSENICQKSSAFYFVNDYLYRPVNEEEVLRKPNVSLRYSDRYYPQSYYADGEEAPQHPNHPQQSQQSQQVQQRVQQVQQVQQQVQQQRRPLATAAPVHHSQQQQQYQSRPAAYRQAGPSNQVFHSPEEVNIPLQLRRPAATTARNFQPTISSVSSDEYDDDEPVYRQG